MMFEGICGFREKIGGRTKVIVRDDYLVFVKLALGQL
jgi:hypothetical protein